MDTPDIGKLWSQATSEESHPEAGVYCEGDTVTLEGEHNSGWASVQLTAEDPAVSEEYIEPLWDVARGVKPDDGEATLQRDGDDIVLTGELSKGFHQGEPITIRFSL